jgi:hypothetical protein
MNILHKFVLGLIVCLSLIVACVSPARQPTSEVPDATATPPRHMPLATATLPMNTPTLPPTSTRPPPQPSATIANESILHTITNDAGSISAVIPSTWTDVRSLTWTNEQEVVIGHKLVASSDVEAFLEWKADGVAIGVSRDLPIGYLQLLDIDADRYGELAPHPAYSFDDFENRLHRGKYFTLWLCGGVQGCLLRVFSLVPQGDGPAYVAEVLLYDDLPYTSQKIEDSIMRFEVDPDRLP